MTNYYAPNLSSVESNIESAITAKNNVMYGGEMSRASLTRVSSKLAAATKVASSDYGDFMNCFVQGEAGLSGGLITIYNGSDDTHEKVIECPVAASSCRSPLNGGMAFPNGWSIYVTGDATNSVFVSYQTYMIAPTAQAEINVGWDTYLSENNPTTNYGTATTALLSYYTAGRRYRPCIKFDLSSIPSNAEIVQAVMQLSIYSITGNFPITINALTTPWTDTEATWEEAKTGDNWTAEGGDYNSTPVWTGNVNSSLGSWLKPDITPLVQSWVDGSLDNNGLIIVCPTLTAATTSIIRTFNHATAAQRPKLFVQY